MQLDLLPDFHRQRRGREASFQQFDGLGDTGVVKLDAQRLGALLTLPVAALEAGLGLGRGGAEQPALAISNARESVSWVGNMSPTLASGGQAAAA
jgi:hypothetical protein